MIDSTILVTVRSRSAGRKFLTPDISDSKLEDNPEGTPVSLSLSARRVEIEEKRPNRSDDGACWLELSIVVSWVILVVARTLRGVLVVNV